jgi:hypothetical protein
MLERNLEQIGECLSRNIAKWGQGLRGRAAGKQQNRGDSNHDVILPEVVVAAAI